MSRELQLLSPDGPVTGPARYLVEKSLSVDDLFVFTLLLSAFAVPAELQQRVLLYGIAGALVLRAIFIALGAAVLANSTFAFLLFGAILLLTAVKILRDQMSGGSHDVDVANMRSVKVLRPLLPVTDDYRGPRLLVQENGVRHATPPLLVFVAIFATDVVFASSVSSSCSTGRTASGPACRRSRRCCRSSSSSSRWSG